MNSSSLTTNPPVFSIKFLISPNPNYVKQNANRSIVIPFLLAKGIRDS